jgi:glutamine synthetase
MQKSLQKVCDLIDKLDAGIEALEAAVNKSQVISKPNMQARAYRDTVIPAMGNVRQAADALEMLVDADLWPLPSYAEMLFLR